MKNIYKNMDIISFNDNGELFDVIDSSIGKMHFEDDTIAVYAKRDLISRVFEHYISNGFKLGYVEMDNLDMMLKDEVYILSICNNYVINIEPAYSPSNDIMKHGAKIAIISMDDCKQDIIDYCLYNNMKVILFDFDCDEYDDEKSECEDNCFVNYSEDDNGNTHGFTVSKSDGNTYHSYSLYTTDELDRFKIHELLNGLGFRIK